MVSNSILPVTIFLLANTLCVSQGAAIGGNRQRLINIQQETEGRGDTNSLTHRVDSEIPTSVSASVESPLPEWVNSRRADKVMNEDRNEESGGDEDDEQAEGVNGLDWSNINEAARFRLKYGNGEKEDDDSLRENKVHHPLFLTSNHLMKPEGEIVMDVPIHGATGVKRFLYNADGVAGAGLRMRLGGNMKPTFIGTIVRRDQIAVKPPQPAVMWPGKSYYGVPAEGFIRANGYDKRSPRCIAKCMQQGMVHPLQCHSLC